MSGWTNTSLHAGHTQLRNSAIAATVLICHWPDPQLGAQRKHPPACTALKPPQGHPGGSNSSTSAFR
jgi:hypothetical protein